MPNSFKCPSCNAPLNVTTIKEPFVKCSYCSSVVSLPKNLWQQEKPSMDGLSSQVFEIQTLVTGGNKIEAIKKYRAINNTSLRDAKNAIEEMLRGQSVIISTAQQTIPNAQQTIFRTTPQTQRKALIIFFIFVGFIMLLGILIPIFFLSEDAGLTSFSSSSKTVLQFGEKGTGVGKFEEVRYLGIDQNEQVYVGDYETKRVQVFDNTGNFLRQWLLLGEGYLTDMAVTPKGNLYAILSGHLFQYNGGNGEPLREIIHPKGGGFTSITALSDGSLLAGLQQDDEYLIHYSPAHTILAESKGLIRNITNKPEPMPMVTVSDDGSMYLLSISQNAVFKYNPQGTYVDKFGGEGDNNGQFKAPYAIGIDAFGQLYVSDIKGVQVFNSEGQYLRTHTVKGFVFDLTFDTRNYLWVVTNNQEVLKLDIND